MLSYSFQYIGDFFLPLTYIFYRCSFLHEYLIFFNFLRGRVPTSFRLLSSSLCGKKQQVELSSDYYDTLLLLSLRDLSPSTTPGVILLNRHNCFKICVHESWCDYKGTVRPIRYGVNKTYCQILFRNGTTHCPRV